MIDLKTLAIAEAVSIKARGVFGAHVIDTGVQAEILRLAMRYLALRDSGIYFSTCNPLSLHGESLDAAADRMIQEMMK